jgi:hypothetical protein
LGLFLERSFVFNENWLCSVKQSIIRASALRLTWRSAHFSSPFAMLRAGSVAALLNQRGKAAGPNPGSERKAAAPANGPSATGPGSFFRFVPVRFFEQNVMSFISGNLANQYFSVLS